MARKSRFSTQRSCVRWPAATWNSNPMICDDFSIKSLIRPVPDFPKPGVIFRDITPLFQSPRAMRMVADSFVQRYVEADFSHIGAMDARGFLIGSIIAYELNKPLILFRKQGKP